MDEGYLWDKRGRDPECEALEALLQPFCHSGRPCQLPRPVPAFNGWFAVAAAAVVVMTGGFAFRPVPGAALRADRAPAPLLVRTASSGEAFHQGSWIHATGDRTELMVGDLGHLVVDEGSRLRITRLDGQEARLYLERGGLLASVSGSARPRFFQVETPATTCVDLGCKYSLKVDEHGDTVVSVLSGRVAFENANREVYVPAQATCRASRAHGASTPRFCDARQELVAALAAFDAAARASSSVRLERARALLAQVRQPRDFLPAWHLMQDEEPAIVSAAVAHLERLAGRPPAALNSGLPGPVERQLWKRHLADQWRR